MKFTSNKPGTYTIPALTKTSGTGEYTVNNSTFTLVVNDNCPSGDTSGNLQDGKCTSNTAPQVSVSGVANATYEHGNEPNATCNVTDTEDTNETANPVIDRSALNSYGLGTVTVKCSYTDAGNLSDSDEVSYKIVDTTKPVIAAHDAVTANAANANGATVNYTAPTANDAVYGSVNVNCSPASGSQFQLGDTTVNCSATDGSGNTQTSTFKVTVADKTAPVIDAHAAVKAEATGPNGATVSYTKPAATDNVDASVTVNCSPASDSQFALGDTTVTCSATDAAGNKATSNFKVTVVDTTGPSITNVPSDITKEATTNAGAPVSFTIPTANDAVDGSRTVTCSPDSGTILPLGLTPVTCSASDASGNTSSAKFNVTVQDTTPPKIATHADITGVEATGPGGAKVTYTSPTATDNVDTSVTVDCSPASGSTFGLGAATTVTCTATDNAGNKATSNFKVTVVDTTAPKLDLPENKTVEATGANGAPVSFARTANDLVDGAVPVNCSVNGTSVKSGDTFGLGTTTVSCSAKDAAGNEASDTFTVTVRDTTAPKLDLPENKTVEATGANGAPVSFARTANDLVDGAVPVNCSVNGTSVKSGDIFGLGTTTVDCSATDRAGNKASDRFTVTVQDTTKPELNLPANITEEATGPNGNVVNYSTSASDLVSGNVNVSCTPASGDTFGITTTTVNCSATDGAGNKATGNFTVKVQDTIAPNSIQFVGGPADGASYDFGDVPAQPTCSAADSGSGLNAAGCVVSGYSTAVGTHTLTATATDKVGNKATKTLSYTVKAWNFSGFYQPVDMGLTPNTVKAGSTVPIKFEIFKGTTELTDTANIVTPLKATVINCSSLATTPDDIELLATGGTSLRYDTTGGQFIYNWQTPKGPVGTCYAVTISSKDGSSKTAYFKLK